MKDIEMTVAMVGSLYLFGGWSSGLVAVAHI